MRRKERSTPNPPPRGQICYSERKKKWSNVSPLDVSKEEMNVFLEMSTEERQQERLRVRRVQTKELLGGAYKADTCNEQAAKLGTWEDKSRSSWCVRKQRSREALSSLTTPLSPTPEKPMSLFKGAAEYGYEEQKYISLGAKVLAAGSPVPPEVESAPAAAPTPDVDLSALSTAEVGHLVKALEVVNTHFPTHPAFAPFQERGAVWEVLMR